MHRHRVRLGVRVLGSIVVVLLVGAPSGASAPAPVKDVKADDHPWDNGEQLDVSWTLSPDDPANIKAYKVLRSMTAPEVEQADADDIKKMVKAAKAEATRRVLEEAGNPEIPSSDVLEQIRKARQEAADEARTEAEAAVAEVGKDRFTFLTFVPAGVGTLTVEKLDRAESYRFRVIPVGQDGAEGIAGETSEAATPTRQPFDGGRFPLAVIVLIIGGAVVLFILRARQGKPLNIRKIAGLEAVQEAVGRATEMGRSVLFIPGIQDMNDIQTIAGMTILSRVARTAAEYDAKVEVPTSRALVMTAARETVQASYLAAGRPDAFNEDNIYYVTDEQFGYVAYLSGAMVRDKPAACFYMGAFFAESLILAETGNSIGAIQVAGTAMPAQLPFFVAACDYTLIGEEFFAASAYLSGEPDQLGSLKGQDVGKVVVAATMVVGVGLATLAAALGSESIQTLVDYLRGTVLG